MDLCTQGTNPPLSRSEVVRAEAHASKQNCENSQAKSAEKYFHEQIVRSIGDIFFIYIDFVATYAIVPAFGSATRLLCLLLTSPRSSAPITRRPASLFRSTGEISRGKTHLFRCMGAGFTKRIPTADGGLRGTGPARSPRMHHASYPVFVHRPVASGSASFRPHLAVTPLPFP